MGPQQLSHHGRVFYSLMYVPLIFYSTKQPKKNPSIVDVQNEFR